jgi:mannan endo-1,4-beta-mannosidase
MNSLDPNKKPRKKGFRHLGARITVFAFAASLIGGLTGVAAQAAPDVASVTRSAEAQSLLTWLSRENPKPALGTWWTDSNGSMASDLGKQPKVVAYEYYAPNYPHKSDCGKADKTPLQNVDGSRWAQWTLVRNHYAAGGVVSFTAHMPNFVTYGTYTSDVCDQADSNQGTSWDRTGNVVTEILPGGTKNAAYRAYLDGMASYFRSFTTTGGELIPILFRPFHEINAGWFWWGGDNAGSTDGHSKVVELWRYTWDYLTNIKGLTNLVWSWSVDAAVGASADFSRFWPGSAYIDLLAIDVYIAPNQGQNTTLFDSSGAVRQAYEALARFAKLEGGFPIAISEFGFQHDLRREPALWNSKLVDFLDTVSVKPSYFLIFGGGYSYKAASYSDPQVKVEDIANFRNFVLPPGKDSRFILLGDPDPVVAPNQVTFDFAENGGTSATVTSTQVASGTAVSLAGTASKPGWVFVGWNTNKDATTGLTSYVMPASNVTLFAIYKKTLTATLKDVNGTVPTTRTVSVTIFNKATSGTVTLPAVNTYAGWTARGWAIATTPNSGLVATTYPMTADVTLYGVYQRTLTMTFSANGGSTTPASKTGTQYVNSYATGTYVNPAFVLPGAVTKSGWVFSGWNMSGTDGRWAPGSTVWPSSNTTWTAQWK